MVSTHGLKEALRSQEGCRFCTPPRYNSNCTKDRSSAEVCTRDWVESFNRFIAKVSTHGLRCGFRIQGGCRFCPPPRYNSNCTKDRSSSTRQPPATLALSSSGIRAGRVPLGVP